MKVAYIAGKFTGPNSWEIEQNIRKAEELAFEVAKLGVMPLCPHTNTRFFAGTLTSAFWYEGTLELMRRCDVVIFTEDWKPSIGANRENNEAIRLELPRFFTVEELKRWLVGEEPPA